MKHILSIIIFATISSAAQAGYSYCSSTNNPYDRYNAETDMVAISKCFKTSMFSSNTDALCQSDFIKIFPEASFSYVRDNIVSETFLTKSNCEKTQDNALSFAEEPYSEGYEEKVINGREYQIINTY